MKTGLILGLALGACASVALAEPASTAAGPTENATIEAHATGPITLSEAEMDKVAAGSVYLPFGFEAISTVDNRTGVIARKLSMTRMYLSD